MATDVSIAISVRDNFSTAITTMQNANRAFNKDLTGLQDKLDTLNKNKITLKVDTDKAKTSLKEAEKAFKDLGEAAGDEQVKALQKANDEYEQARRNLDLVSKQARTTEKDIINLTGTMSKANNKAGIGGKDNNSLMSSLASAGAYKLIGDTVSNIAAGFAGSAFGAEGSSMFSSILSGAASGAAVGTMMGNPLAGAAVGVGLGIANGITNIEKNKDDAFKSVVQSYYENAMESQNQTLSSGSSIAGNREMKQISFATLLGGDEAANDYLAEMTDFANKTPFGYDQLATISKTMLAYDYKVEELLPELTKIGDAGSGLDMSAEDMNRVATGLGRMRSTGKTTLEYLNPLLERGIKVWDYLAEASGKTKAEVQEMVSKGLVPGAEAAKAISDYMGAEFAGNMEKQSKAFEGLMSSLEDAQMEMDNAMGEGYNDERKKGIQSQIDYFEGESGEKIKEANRMIGQWKASLENLAEEYERDALNAVMTGITSNIFSSDVQTRLSKMYDEYTKHASEGTEEAGAKMGALLAEAQAIAQNEYNASEGAQLQLDTQRELAKRIGEDTALKDEYWNAGYIMGQEFSKGRAAGISFDTSDLGPANMYTYTGGGHGQRGKPVKSGKYAYGLNYVPYDNFPALLHQGERVLTASENRNSKTIPQVNITGNEFNVRSDDDIERIGDIIVKKIITAYEVM